MDGPTFSIIYALLTVGYIFFEGLAMGSGVLRNTISWHIWSSRGRWVVLLLSPFWFWMTGHFWNPYEPDSTLINDYTYLGIGLVIGILNFVVTRRRIKEKESKQEHRNIYQSSLRD